MEEADTFPKLLILNSQRWSNRVAQRHKRLGIWKEYTWEDFYSKVRSLALGLLSLGIQPGSKAAIIGDNTPEWFWAELAIQCTQGVSVGIYPDMSASEVKYLLELSDSEIEFVKDQEQVGKLLESKDELPLWKKVIYWESKGLVSYKQPVLVSFAELIELGMEYEQQNPGIFEQTVEQGKGEKREEIFQYFRETFLTKTRDDWLQILRQRDTCVAPVYSTDDVASDPHLVSHGVIAELDHPTMGRIKPIGPLIRLSESEFSVRNWCSVFGQHTKEIMRELGYDQASISRLYEEEVIG